MARGFLAGIFWGGVVGVGALGVSSQTMERQQLSFPKPEAANVEVPGGSQFDQARADEAPVLPSTDEGPSADAVADVAEPELEETPPEMDTAALEIPQPETSSPSGLGDAPPVAEGTGLSSDSVSTADQDITEPTSPEMTEPEAPAVAPEPITSAPESISSAADEGTSEDSPNAPEASDEAPSVATDIAALPAENADETPTGSADAPIVVPEASAPASPVSPEISESPSLPGVRVPDQDDEPSTTAAEDQPVAPEPGTPNVIATEAPSTPEDVPEVADAPEEAETSAEPEQDGNVITVDGGDSQFFTPVDTLDDQAEEVETGRLPTIGSDEEIGALPTIRRLPGTTATDVVEAPEAEPSEPEGLALDGPAIEMFAADIEVPNNAALVSIVLIHQGTSVPSPAELEQLPFAVAFAVDAGLPEAAEIAASYRRAGREVVMIPSLPIGATPQDVEVALSANLQDVPEAVAVMDVSGSSFQSDRAAVAQVVAVVGDTGHGVITFPRGLNSAHQQAERAGLPTGLIFRLLDDDGESDDQIRRTLDRAAFRARQNTAVILVGRSQAETMQAVTGWAMEVDAGVAIAPISQALRR